MKYSIITTTTNIKMLHKTALQINKLNTQPFKWYIFNDSPEEYPELEIKNIDYEFCNYKQNNEWYYLRLAKNLRTLTQKIPKKEWKQIDYIMKLDDDTILEPNYIEQLQPFLEKSNFGCISGKILSLKNGEYIEEKRINHYAIGTGMLMRKEIIDYHKGYPAIAGSDTLLNLTSRIMGYQNQQLNHVYLKQERLTCENAKIDRTMASAIKQHYLKYPKWIIILNFVRNYKKSFLQKYLEYYKIIKKVPEEIRLQDKKIIGYNKRRLYYMIIRDIRRKVFK